MKNWYKVEFYAEMDDKDIRAMNKYFFESMADAMDIENCEGLKITPDEPSSDPDDEIVDTIQVREGMYTLGLAGNIVIDKKACPMFFVPYALIKIIFLDEVNEDGCMVRVYRMTSEGSKYIFADYEYTIN